MHADDLPLPSTHGWDAGWECGSAVWGRLRFAAESGDAGPEFRQVTLTASPPSSPRKRLAAAAAGPMADLFDFLSARLESDPTVILGVLRAVLLTPHHAEQLGTEIYPAVTDRLIDAVTLEITS